jgi:hypothetical protein
MNENIKKPIEIGPSIKQFSSGTFTRTRHENGETVEESIITIRDGAEVSRLVTVNILPDTTLQLVRDLVEGRLTHDPDRQKMSRVPAAPKPPEIADHSPFGYFHRPNYDGRTFQHFMTHKKITVKTRNVYGKLIVSFEDGTLGNVSEKELQLVYMPA